MKVLHVLVSRIYTGAEQVVSQIIRSFADTDIQMAYCAPESDNVRAMLEKQGIVFLAVPEVTPRTLAGVLRRWQPDVIHAHDMRASFVAALCCGSIPLVSHIHNNAYDARGFSLKSVAYLLAGARAKEILWVSRSSYEGYVFHRLFEKKSRVLYNIIDTRRVFDLLARDEHTYDFDMIYVGRLTYQKDPQRLMDLCALVRRSKPDLKVAVVGAGELEEQTRQRCRALGLEDTVRFLGFQQNPIKMVHDSGVLVLTSRWEGTPMCALEAMALGVPVVSTPSDGMADIIENGVNGYLEDRDEALAAAILKILGDDAHRQTLSRNTVRKFAAINDAEGYRAAIERCYR